MRIATAINQILRGENMNISITKNGGLLHGAVCHEDECQADASARTLSELVQALAEDLKRTTARRAM